MPPSGTILEQLATTTNELTILAIAWHLAIVSTAIAVLAGWRPLPRQASLLLVMPIVSVAMISTAYRSWFNAISFALLALVLTIIPMRWRLQGPAWSRWLGIALVVYGLCYPHFVEGPWYRTMYAAPVGIVPCPTLAVVIGFALLGRAGGSRAIPAVLAVWATFYALFGIFVLGVVLDVGLLIGALGIATACAIGSTNASNAATSASQRPINANKVAATLLLATYGSSA